MPSRTDVYAKKPVTVFDEHRPSFQFARDIAEFKSLDSNRDAFYIADIGLVHSLVTQWRQHLPRVRPFYSVNCNSDEMMLRVMSSCPEMSFHCVTREDLRAVMDVAEPNRIFYSNPCWTRRAVRDANDADVNLLGFDSARDLQRILESHSEARLVLNVRVNKNTNDGLGCDLDDAPELLEQAANLGLRCVGVGFNLGSGCGRGSFYDSAIECAAQLLTMGRKMGLEMNVLSLGGGFASFRAKDSATFPTVAAQINESLDFYLPKTDYPSLQIIATPGRFFAGPVFSLITNVIECADVDASLVTNDDFDLGQRGFVYRTNEGYYGPFGCRAIADCEPECEPLFEHEMSNSNNEDHFYGSVLGPNVDDEFDVVQSVCRFRRLFVGDWLLWSNMGSYSMNNRASLDDCLDKSQPFVYYFANEHQWKQTNGQTMMSSDVGDEQSDTESVASEDSGCSVEPDLDEVVWLFS